MSLGERAVLEGALSQLTPSLAIEIGTSAGGSLKRIARHSGHVHTFDLDDHVADKTAPGTSLFIVATQSVCWRRGWSDAPRPALRSPLHSPTGDHSPAGVRADLETLAASRACARAGSAW
jgi:hypothetical protein